MGDEFTTGQPIYLQLVQHICRHIARGDVDERHLRRRIKLPAVTALPLVM